MSDYRWKRRARYWLKKHGIISGFSGRKDQDELVEDLAKLLERIYNIPGAL